MDFPVLSDFQNFLDIRIIPFTSRGSRLSVVVEGKGICLRLTDRLRSQDIASRIGQNLPALVEEINFFDGEGNILEYSIQTYPHCLIFETKIGKFYLTFEDGENILIAPPAQPCGLGGRINLNEMDTDRRGGMAVAQGEDRTRLVYSTNRKILNHHVEKMPGNGWKFKLIVDGGNGGGILLHISTRLGLARYVNDPRVVLNRAAQIWQDWFSRVPKIALPDHPYKIAWWLLRSGLVSTRFYLSREVLVSSKKHSTTIWQWDACFYAMAYRHIDRKLAQDQLRIFFDHQAPSGMIPDGIYESGVIIKREQSSEADWSRPPLLAWTIWKLFERDGDVEFLNEIYDGLSRWLKWWLDLYDHGLSLTSSTSHSLFAEDMDDPVILEEMPGNISPEMSVFLYLQLDYMAKISHAVGEYEDSEDWSRQAQRILSQVQSDEEAGKGGLFWIQQQGRPVCVPTPLSLIGLLCGDCEADATQKMVAHLSDEDGVWKNFPLPTILIENDDVENQRLWQSPEWLSVFYLLLEGLDRSNLSEIANHLCRQLLDRLNNRFGNEQKGSHAPIYGWAAALYIELAVRAAQVDAIKAI
ncbi:MAG: MGH1-like glycoside hydrolase domain-containing protein [Bellilinea sp.]